VNVTTFGISPINSLTQFNGNIISTDQIIANSCLTRRNQDQGKFTVTGSGGLPVTPYTDIDGWYGITPQPSNTTSQQKPSTLLPVATASKTWKIGDPSVEATGIMRTADGRTLLGAIPQNTPESANSLECHSNEDQPKS